MLDEATLITQLTPEILRKIVAGFYSRVKLDDIIGPMYPPDDWAGAEKRLGDFLCYRFLGDATYLQERGHPKLRMRHFPFSIGTGERDRWMELMNAALAEIPAAELSTEANTSLSAFFLQVADHMRNQMER